MLKEIWKEKVAKSGRIKGHIVKKSLYFNTFKGLIGRLYLNGAEKEILHSLDNCSVPFSVVDNMNFIVKNQPNSKLYYLNLDDTNMSLNECQCTGLSSFDGGMPILNTTTNGEIICSGEWGEQHSVKRITLNDTEIWSHDFHTVEPRKMIKDYNEELFFIYDDSGYFGICRKSDGIITEEFSVEGVDTINDIQIVEENIFVLGRTFLFIIRDGLVIDTVEGHYNHITIENNIIYAGAWGEIFAYDVDRKQEIYLSNISLEGSNNGQQMNPLIVSDYIVIGSNNSYLWLLNKYTGEVLDKVKHGDFVYNVLEYEGDLIAFDLDSTITRYSLG